MSNHEEIELFINEVEELIQKIEYQIIEFEFICVILLSGSSEKPILIKFNPIASAKYIIFY